jgi:hypothetical protein
VQGRGDLFAFRITKMYARGSRGYHLIRAVRFSYNEIDRTSYQSHHLRSA